MTTQTSTRLRVTLAEVRDLGTITVEQAGALLGLGRSGAYDAARRGEIPTIHCGRRVLVPVPALLRLLGDEPASA